MRELLWAMLLNKPIVALFETDAKYGGILLKSAREQLAEGYARAASAEWGLFAELRTMADAWAENPLKSMRCSLRRSSRDRSTSLGMPPPVSAGECSVGNATGEPLFSHEASLVEMPTLAEVEAAIFESVPFLEWSARTALPRRCPPLHTIRYTGRDGRPPSGTSAAPRRSLRP
jgi:hypothetical protein